MGNLKSHWEDEKEDFPEDVRRKYRYTAAAHRGRKRLRVKYSDCINYNILDEQFFNGQMLPQLEQDQSDCVAFLPAYVYATATACKENLQKYLPLKSLQMEGIINIQIQSIPLG